MGHWTATSMGIKATVKRVAGVPYRARVEEAWGFSEGEFWAYQESAFRRMYDWSRGHVPYYRDLPAEYLALESVWSGDLLSSLESLPVLSKASVRENNRRLWAEGGLLPRSVNATSGTTGTPLRLPSTLLELGFWQEIYEHWTRFHMGSRSPRTLHLTGFVTPSDPQRELYWRDYSTNSLYLSIYSLVEGNRGRIVDLIRRFDPRRIAGYSSSVNELATLLGDSVKDTQSHRTAVVTSEVLNPEWKVNIERHLCRRVLQVYSSQEVSHAVMQCAHGGMHIDPLTGIVEIVDEQNRRVRPGEVGKVLVTGLLRRSMPLIRYDIGDAAESTGYATDCGCGLQFPRIGRVEGRAEDLVRTRDGRRIGYLCFHATKQLPGINEAQLVQIGYEDFIFNVVKTPGASVSTELLETKICEQLNTRLQFKPNVEFRWVSTVPRTSNGKFRAVVVDPAFLRQLQD